MCWKTDFSLTQNQIKSFNAQSLANRARYDLARALENARQTPQPDQPEPTTSAGQWPLVPLAAAPDQASQ